MADTKARDTRYDDEAEEHVSASRYVKTRFSTLKPPMDKVANPFKLLAMLNTQQWLFFAVRVSRLQNPVYSRPAISSPESDQYQVAFLSWSWDAFDFFTVRSESPFIVCSGESNDEV